MDAALDIERLDAVLEQAIRAGSASGLRVLGFGETALVVGWPTEAPRFAVKRLPPLPDQTRADAYAQLLATWIQALERAGVPVLETSVRWVAGRGASMRAYLVQPYAERTDLLNQVLQDAAPERGAALLDRLADHVCAAVDERLGLDAQPANWVVDGGTLRCVDVSTPLMRDAAGADRLDVGLFLAAYPWALRRALVPIAHQVMAQYHDPRAVLVDAASNLVKEQLGRWLPELLAAAARRVQPPIDEQEVRRYYARDRRLWLLMQRLRRADRAWQRLVRRRPYPFLLPPPYQYGPSPRETRS